MNQFQMAVRFQQVLFTIATVSAFALISLLIIGSEKSVPELKTAEVQAPNSRD